MRISDMNSFAIVQTAFLGDTALTIPLVGEIKRINPQAKIIFITAPRGYHLVKCSNQIDDVIVFDKYEYDANLLGIKRVASLISEYKPDCLITAHRSFRSSLLSFLVNSKIKVGYRNSSLNFVYNHKVEYIYHFHEIDKLLNLLSVFDDFKLIPAELSLVSDFTFQEFDFEFVNQYMHTNTISEKSEPIAAVAPGSIWATKRWKAEYYLELVKKLGDLNIKTILIGSPDEYELCEKIALESNCINSAGVFSIPQLLILLQKCVFVITNDSAPTHLAGLVDTPVLTLFGPTSPLFGFSPRNANGRFLEVGNLACKPCRIHGSNKCPTGTMECMTKLSPDLVMSEIMQLLKNEGKFISSDNF